VPAWAGGGYNLFGLYSKLNDDTLTGSIDVGGFGADVGVFWTFKLGHSSSTTTAVP
jgi:hypothetical protein